MIRFISSLVFVFAATLLSAQTGAPLASAIVPTLPTKTYTAAPVPFSRPVPVLPSAAGSLGRFLAEHLDYPELARENSLEGMVVISITVSPTGKATYLRTLKSVNLLLDEEAIAVIDELPRFLPAVHEGVAVAHTLTVPVRFRMR